MVPVKWSCVVQSCVFHTCDLVLRFPVLFFHPYDLPPPRHPFSSPAFSTPVFITVLRFPFPRFQRISNSIDKAPPDDATVCTECTTQPCVAAGNDPVESPPPSRDILPVPIPSPFYHTTATLYSTLGSDSLTTYNSPETAFSLRADFNTADDNDASIPYNTRCYVNARSKTDMSQLKLPHGNDN